MPTRATTDRVVCALDDSTHAEDVFATATALAGRLDLWLTVVHSPTPDVYVVGGRLREVVRAGEDFVARIVAGQEVDEVIVRPGDPARILADCLRGGAGMVVLGSRGRGPARAALLGSVAAEVTRGAPCPVVIVPPGASLAAFAPQPAIVCGLDGSAAGSHALAWATRLAWTTGGRVLVTHVRRGPSGGSIEEGGAALAQVEREAADLTRPVQASMHVETGDPAQRLDELARSHGADLIAVGSHRHGALRAAVGGSVSARLAAHAGTPVVVVAQDARLDAVRGPMSVHVAA